MTPLSLLLPGLRDFRTPFSSGLLWLSALTLGLFPVRDSITSHEGFSDLHDLIGSLPDVYATGAAAFVAYVLGLVSVQVQGFVSDKVSRQRRQRTKKRADLRRPPRWRDRLANWLYPPNQQRSALLDTVKRRTVATGTARSLDDLIPNALILNETELATLRFSKDHPDQYQQYDRIKAEAEFRTSVAVPLGACCIALAALLTSPVWSPIFTLAGVALGISLSAQGYRNSTQAENLILTAMTLGWATGPALEHINYELGLPNPKQNGPLAPDDQYALILNTVITTLNADEVLAYLNWIFDPMGRGKIWPVRISDDAARRVRSIGLSLVPPIHLDEYFEQDEEPGTLLKIEPAMVTALTTRAGTPSRQRD